MRKYHARFSAGWATARSPGYSVTECDPIEPYRHDDEANAPARVLIHNEQDLVGAQPGRLAGEQIHTQEIVFRGAEES
jgi:hypothetical protein